MLPSGRLRLCFGCVSAAVNPAAPGREQLDPPSLEAPPLGGTRGGITARTKHHPKVTNKFITGGNAVFGSSAA